MTILRMLVVVYVVPLVLEVLGGAWMWLLKAMTGL